MSDAMLNRTRLKEPAKLGTRSPHVETLSRNSNGQPRCHDGQRPSTRDGLLQCSTVNKTQIQWASVWSTKYAPTAQPQSTTGRCIHPKSQSPSSLTLDEEQDFTKDDRAEAVSISLEFQHPTYDEAQFFQSLYCTHPQRAIERTGSSENTTAKLEKSWGAAGGCSERADMVVRTKEPSLSSTQSIFAPCLSLCGSQ